MDKGYYSFPKRKNYPLDKTWADSYAQSCRIHGEKSKQIFKGVYKNGQGLCNICLHDLKEKKLKEEVEALKTEMTCLRCKRKFYAVMSEFCAECRKITGAANAESPKRNCFYCGRGFQSTRSGNSCMSCTRQIPFAKKQELRQLSTLEERKVLLAQWQKQT